MAISYRSTRDQHATPFLASQAVLQGLSPDGGLFVPDHLPQLNLELMDLPKLTYQELAFKILQPFFSDYTATELQDCIAKAYGDNFTSPQITPVKFTADLAYLELFHGPTIAFKDLALQLLPHLLQLAAKKNQTALKTVILTATSGDTGKAAMAGFADVKDTQIIVFYPKDGVSEVQEKQMRSQTGANTHVVAITGNFDDAQTKVKEIFDDPDMALALQQKGYRFSSANSINIGRLIPQVVYYVYAYAKLLENDEIRENEPVNVVVPTGNFGNILAAYYAKLMGVPIDKLICASNENKVLFDFFRTGVYDKNRDFVLTSSPSMDILISSNLERLIYLIAGEDSDKTRALMEELKGSGRYEISDEMKERLESFLGGYASEEETAKEISRVYEKTGYVLDTHTAVASHVCRKLCGDDQKCVIASTASPYKFVKSVMTAIDSSYGGKDEFALLETLRDVSKTPMPQAIKDILEADIVHRTECDADKMKETVKDILGI